MRFMSLGLCERESKLFFVSSSSFCSLMNGVFYTIIVLMEQGIDGKMII